MHIHKHIHVHLHIHIHITYTYTYAFTYTYTSYTHTYTCTYTYTYTLAYAYTYTYTYAYANTYTYTYTYAYTYTYTWTYTYTYTYAYAYTYTSTSTSTYTYTHTYTYTYKKCISALAFPLQNRTVCVNKNSFIPIYGCLCFETRHFFHFIRSTAQTCWQPLQASAIPIDTQQWQVKKRFRSIRAPQSRLIIQKRDFRQPAELCYPPPWPKAQQTPPQNFAGQTGGPDNRTSPTTKRVQLQPSTRTIQHTCHLRSW